VPSRPGQPLVVSQTDTGVTLSWDAPSWDGGAAVLQYVVERREMRGPRWVRVHKSSVAGPSYSATDLLPASCYQFRVHAANALGLSQPSAVSKIVACQRTGPNRSAIFLSQIISLHRVGTCPPAKSPPFRGVGVTGPTSNSWLLRAT